LRHFSKNRAFWTKNAAKNATFCRIGLPAKEKTHSEMGILAQNSAFLDSKSASKTRSCSKLPYFPVMNCYPWNENSPFGLKLHPKTTIFAAADNKPRNYSEEKMQGFGVARFPKNDINIVRNQFLGMLVHFGRKNPT
jgi:hypothetical protein